MPYRVEKLGIGPSKTSQLLGVELVGLSLPSVDQPGLARVGHEHLVSAPFEDPAHPGRVGSDLDGNLQLPFGVEAAKEAVGGGAQPPLFDEFAAFSVLRTYR